MKLSSWRTAIWQLPLLLIALAFAVQSFAQQTLGSINGTVVDASGAAVVNATVTATCKSINVTRTTTTQKTGFYQIFNLPVGIYTVKISQQGFESTQIGGIAVHEAGATTVNTSLKVGEANESVEVTANPLLNATDTTNGYTLDAQQIAETPLATGSFTQLAVLSPGVNAELLTGVGTNTGLGNQSIWANGQRATSNTFQINGVDATNLFNGMTSSGDASQRYNFNIGAGSTSATSAAGSATVAGAAATGTSVYGSNGNSLPSPPPEFLQELRVNTSMYDAQQGATSGAQIDANTNAGSNQWHGQVYGSFANNSLNAAPYFFNQQYQLAQQGIGYFPESLANPSLHRWTMGGTVGGPVIKDKLFFFAGYQRLYDSDQFKGLSQVYVPTGLSDDRSLGGLQAALASYNGSTISSIDPVAMALLNAKAPDGSYLIPSAQTSDVYPTPDALLFGKSLFTGDQGTGSLDYNATANDRISAKYYYQNDPVTAPYNVSNVQGFPSKQKNGSQVGVIDNTTNIGSHVNWEQRLGFIRMYSYSYFDQNVSCDGDLTCGISMPTTSDSGTVPNTMLPGIELQKFGSSNGGTVLKLGPYSSFVNAGYYQNRINPSTNLIMAVGKHTLTMGGGYSYTQLNVVNNRTGIGQVVVKDFPSFLQGKTRGTGYSSVLDSIAGGHNVSNRYYRSDEYSGYVQDKYQVLPNLSLTAGVRFDYHGGLTEKYGNMFNFDPGLYDVTGTTTTGFVVNNGGFLIAHNNPFCKENAASCSSTDSTLTGRQWGISPRIGFAWSPKRDNGHLVVRGGAGIYYDRGELFSYLSQPAGSSTGGPFGVTEAPPLVNLEQSGGSGQTLSNPLGNSPYCLITNCAPSADPNNFTQLLQSTLNQMTGTTTGEGLNCGAYANQDDYTLCPSPFSFGAYDRANKLPYTINYTASIEWQPRYDMAITIGYTGNRGRHAVIPLPLNEPQIATAGSPAMVEGKEPHPNGESSTYGYQVLNGDVAPVGYSYYGDAIWPAISTEPWNTYDGGNVDFRVPYPGYSPNSALFKAVGVSSYDALETHIEKRLSHHFQFGASYTFSHTLDEQSDMGLFFTGDNPNHLRDSWGSADFDRTHVFTANFQAQVPNAVHNAHSLMGEIVDGWHLTGIGVLESGEPYSLYEFYGAVGSLYFGNYPTLDNPILPVKDPSNVRSAISGKSGAERPNGAYVPAIDLSQIEIPTVDPGQKGIPSCTGSEPCDIFETDFVQGQRNIFRQSAQKRLDLSFRKSFSASDKVHLLYEFDIFNITNTPSFDVPQNQTEIGQADAVPTDGVGPYASQYGDAYPNYGQVISVSGQQANASGPNGNVWNNLYAVPDYNKGTGTSSSNLGSVTNTIGSARQISMALHITF
ncbi:MAG TPA: carboxypeptidase regulatory-like domain-containing protein [Terracidiphilus sp.]|nr:carboxypeptidase regulatory-like domain-containing protein [Terracidiphilus sp.]